MDAGLGSTMVVNPRCTYVILFSFVMDLADNFNAFRTSEVKKKPFLWGCDYHQDQDALQAHFILRHYLKWSIAM